MEQNPENIANQQAITPDTSTIPHSSQPVSQSAFSPKVLLIGLVLLVATGAAGYLLGSTRTQSTQPVATPLPIVVEKSALTATQQATPPAVTNQNAETITYYDPGCGVTFTMPGKQAPYYPEDPNREPSETAIIGNGSYWQAPRGGISPNLMILVNAPAELNNEKQANAMFGSDAEGSGYIAAAVSVTCQENSEVVRTEDIPSAVGRGIEAYNDPGFFKGMGTKKYDEPTVQLMQKWGKSVYYFLLNDREEYYAFVHNGKLYEVQSIGQETDPVIVKQRAEIFDSLKFD